MTAHAAPHVSTESQLRDWRLGPVVSQRLGADLLQLSGYVDVEPIAVMGGPDRGRDVLCRRGTIDYVVAIYFPTGDQTFPTVRRKFNRDLSSASRHGRPGFGFVTNQNLTSGERDELYTLGRRAGRIAEIFDRERLRVLLDTTPGYGLRLSYLGIPMSPEEQLGYFAATHGTIESKLDRHTTILRHISRRLELLVAGQDVVGQTMAILADRLGDPLDLPAASREILSGPVVYDPASGRVTDQLHSGLLLAIHRFACPDLSPDVLGRLRTIETVIAMPEVAAGAELETPRPDEVPGLVDELLERWRSRYSEVISRDRRGKLLALAEFHSTLLSIHPFVDGNGRAARALLIQQVLEFFGSADPSRLDRGVQYYRALRQADQGDAEPLAQVIAAITANQT